MRKTLFYTRMMLVRRAALTAALASGVACGAPVLLPPSDDERRRPWIVLDLDETLLHSIEIAEDPSAPDQVIDHPHAHAPPAPAQAGQHAATQAAQQQPASAGASASGGAQAAAGGAVSTGSAAATVPASSRASGTTTATPAAAAADLTKRRARAARLREAHARAGVADCEVGDEEWRARVYVRPLARHALAYMARFSTLAVYSAGTRDYVEECLAKTGLGKHVRVVLAREDCEGPRYAKDLRKVGAPSVAQCVLFDDRPRSRVGDQNFALVHGFRADKQLGVLDRVYDLHAGMPSIALRSLAFYWRVRLWPVRE